MVPSVRTAWRRVLLSVVRALGALGMTAAARAADPAPPLQYFVADIGAEPLRAGTPADFEAGSAFTMEGWIFLTGTYPRHWLMGKAAPIDGGAGGMALNFGLQLDDAGSGLRFVTAGLTLAAPGPLPQRTWTHVAVTLEGGTTRLLVNGAVVATRTESPAIPAAPTLPFGVGAAFDAAGRPAAGEPAVLFARQVRFWSVARSAAQIADAMGEVVPGARTGLVASWPLDESGGTTLRDVGGRGRALTKADIGGAMRRAVLERGPYFVSTPLTVGRAMLPDPSSTEVIDFDHDGDPDLIVMQVKQPPTYPETLRRVLAFRNNNGTFVEATDAVLGTVMMVNPYRTWVADFNGDGRSDLFIAGTGTDMLPVPGEQSRLFIQSADGRLVDESAVRLPQRNHYTHDVASADIDGDGDLDLYLVSNIAPHTPRLYLNNGAGVFTDTANRLPADVASGFSENPGACFADLNRDGRPELVLGGVYYAPNGPNSTRPNVLLMNDGTGRFGRDPAFALPPKLHGIEGVTPRIVTADFDGNGAADLLLSTDRGAVVPGLQLLLNDGTGRLREANAQLNVTYARTDQWVVLPQAVDFNRDGRPDLVLRMNSANYAPVNSSRTLLLNRGNAVFADVSEVFRASTNSGISVGDFDRDGLTDLLTLYSDQVIVHRATKPIDLALFAEVAPVFTTQPSAGTAIVGSRVELVATAAGSPLPSLQWRKDGAAIPGATDAILAIPAAVLSDAGSYSVIATNAAGTATSAVATFAVSAEVPRLTNVSTRAPAGSGANTLIVGFGIAGTGEKTVLLRGVGPTLGVLGVDNFVADPAVALFAGERQIARNEDWEAALAADFAAAGAFPLGSASKDAALKVTLAPGSYTVHLLNPGPTAEALVEVYDLSRDAGTQLANLSCRLALPAGGTVIVGAVLAGGTRPLLVRNVGPGLAPFGVAPVQENPRLEIFSGARSVAANDDWAAALEPLFAAVGAFALPRGSRDAAERLVAPAGGYTVHATGAGAGIVLIELYAAP